MAQGPSRDGNRLGISPQSAPKSFEIDGRWTERVLIMDESRQTIVIVLCMHRSGSSVTTRVLWRQGMSLGPFELLEATPSNPHGHFEAVPICELSRTVQELAFGFRDDLPETPEGVSHFVETQGRWDERLTIPDELLQRGRSLIGDLLASGRISGFKDPRAVLLWPFWRQVLAAFPAVRVAPVVLLRSPHEIAMSMFARREGGCSYWTSLDVVAIHLRRLQAFVREWPQPVPKVRFGGLGYFGDLEQAIQSCGLEWDPLEALRMFDGSCVHQTAAVVAHEAQQVYDSLAGTDSSGWDSAANLARLEADARARDELQCDRLRRAWELAAQNWRELGLSQSRLDQATEQAIEALRQLERSREELRHESQARLRADQVLEQAREELRHESQARLRADQDLLRADQDLKRVQEQLDQSLRDGDEVWVAYQGLRRRLDRIEAHPVLGLALKGRRELKRTIARIKARREAG